MTAVSLQAAFVLHHRPYRDTSVIADLLTPDFGRVSVIAKGVRTAKSRRLVLLQPFRPVLASWSGRSNLHTLGALEESGMPISLTGSALACAYYVTELVLKLIPADISNPTAFALYARTLSSLASEDKLEEDLRFFEIELLDSLGELPDFSSCEKNGGEIEGTCEYQFDPVSCTAVLSSVVTDTSVPISGTTLLAMANRDFSDAKVLLEAKRLMRRIVQVQLGGRPLKSREVFAQLKLTGQGDN